MKPIRLSGHALEQLHRRGVTEEEVKRAIREAEWHPSDRGRFECRLEVAFGETWNRKHYAIKQVRPIFVEEMAEIVVVTVYSYFY